MAKKKHLPLLIPVAALLCLALLLHLLGALSSLDDHAGDLMLAQHAGSRTPPQDIVLLAIDQKSLEDETLKKEAGSWPWPRAIHGELIANLQSFKPQAIIFDVLFNEADIFRPDSDTFFRDTARQYDNLFFPSLLLVDGLGAPLASLPGSWGIAKTDQADAGARAPLLVPTVLDRKNWQGGLINFEQDSDGTGRHARLFTEISGWHLPTLTASVARRSGATLPEAERVRLHWYDKSIRVISYADLFNDLALEKPVIAPELKGSIVLIGATAPGLNDFRPTPLGLTPGSLVLTTGIANLRANDWLRELPLRWPLVLVLTCALTFAFFRRVHLLTAGSGLGLVTLALTGTSYWLLDSNMYLPVGAALALAWLAYGLFAAEAYWRERRDRMDTVALFGRFLDPRVVSELVKTGELSRETEPLARDITVLFSDIRGFTSLSETRTPQAVVELLNRHFQQHVRVIFHHGGTLDKFIGDAIMAFWNAPTETPGHAVHAVQAAIEMSKVMDSFKHQLMQDPATATDSFDIGIGLHTGPAVVGFLGSDDRLDYTAIGDTVNLASRIEGCTKGVARVLISEATRDACEIEAPGRFEFISHGRFEVKGRDQGVQLFEPRMRA